MNKLKLREKSLIIRSVGTSIGFFLIALGLFRLISINTSYLMIILIIIGTILVVWESKLEKKIK